MSVKEIFAFITVSPDGEEGIMTTIIGGEPFPLVSMSRRTAFELMRPRVMATAKTTGIKVTLVRFTNREDLEEFT